MTDPTASLVLSRPRLSDSDPFRRDGLLRRIGPFAAVALMAEASLALPPGPGSTNYTIISIALLFCAAGCIFLPWTRLPSWGTLAVPLLYVGSVLTLVLAAGGSTSGVGIVILIPLAWSALYHPPRQSVIVVGAVIAYQAITAIYPVRVADAVLIRRLVFWSALATLISFATHELRSRIQRMLDQRQDLIAQREVALEEMSHSIDKLEERDRQSRLLIDLGETLQACVRAEEAYRLIELTGEQLFQGGALSIFNSSRNHLETVTSWGLRSSTGETFSPDECWALRRGRVHASDEPRFVCVHLGALGSTQAICVPMMAQGDTMGVLHIFFDLKPGAMSEDIKQNSTQLALAVSEQVGMSLANFRLRDTLRNQSIRDPLTNLFNRRYMEETFDRELARASRDKTEVGIMQIDIDHFKVFNDTYGHDIGDALLRSFGDLLLALFRDFDVPCRFGGEEFTLLLTGSSLAYTQRRAEELQRCALDLKLASDLKVDVAPPPPTLSIGIAVFPTHGNTAEKLIRAADQALYAAKANGRNTIVCAPLPETSLAATSSR